MQHKEQSIVTFAASTTPLINPLYFVISYKQKQFSLFLKNLPYSRLLKYSPRTESIW